MEGIDKSPDDSANQNPSNQTSFSSDTAGGLGEQVGSHVIRDRLSELGSGFLVYLLLMELGKLSTSTLECYAISIRSLHDEVHNPKSLNQRVSHLRTLNILHHGIEILEAHFQQGKP